MKKLFIVLMLVTTSLGLAKAQVIDTLPTNKDEFVKELVKMFDATKRSELKDLSKSFEKAVMDGSLSPDMLSKMIVTSNKMLEMRGKAYPQLVEVTKTYMTLSSLNLSNERKTDFQETLLALMENSKKGDTKTAMKFFEFVIPLYEKNALYASSGKDWLISSDIFTLSYGENGPIVRVPKTNILGKSPNDSTVIYNSGGYYDYFNTTWHGEKGEVDWIRAGLPKDEVFCTFDDYTIDMSTQSYEVDTVTFTYKNYFSRSLKGRLEDMLTAVNNEEISRFPRFVAFSDNVPPQVISENVMYYGGFTLAGSKISGASDNGEALLEIFLPNSKKRALVATCESVTINKPEKVTASNAKVSLYFDEDSIHHPSVTVIYNLQTNEIRLVKGEGALAQSKFLDSYHKMDFEADVLTWNLNNTFIDINTVSTSGNKASSYESQAYFSKEKMQQIRGNVSYDPLSILNKYSDTYQYDEIHANEYAKLISPNLTLTQIKPLLFTLIQEGFITFDEKSSMIQILPKVKHYVKANAKLIDFDNIFILSRTKKQNGRIDLVSKDIHLEGVESVPVSVVNSTIFIPDSLKITIKKNRDMEFDGLFFLGRLDLFGKDNYFHYDSFNMTLPQIDTLIFNIPDGEKTDAYGNPITRPLNSTLEELRGSANINIAINKSGRADLPQFPVFTSLDKSKIYYDNPNILGGAYSRESFYYELEPFVLDSLNNLDRHNLSFDGTLYSSDIFPAINQAVSVQPDLSLGFELSSPTEGFDVYHGKGKFISDIRLNNDGLMGQGIIKYQTTSFESSNIVFYPDSLIATTDTFGVKESKGVYESPWVKSAQNLVKWYPYLDSMIAYSDNVNPFNMYDERIELDGELIITDEGISGGGIADWEDAQLISNRFEFKADQILSDTAELKIKTIDGDKVTFNTPNVNAFVDFTDNTGFFKSNTDDNRTEFNYNQYFTTIDEFFWDIDNKKLEFSVPNGAEGAPFTSIHPDQDSLGFDATSADYSLVSSVIEAHGVKEILVADSRVIPFEGEVVVAPEAKMETLTKAVIEASAESKRHIIENVTASIKARNKMDASGDYKYSTRDTDPQYIDLAKISVVVADSSVLNKKKVTDIPYILTAEGTISQNDDFVLYPNVSFYGDVSMYSSLDNLKFKGFTKIDFQNEYIISDFFELETEVDPQNLKMQIAGAKDPSGQEIRTGIFVNKVGLDPIYTNIMNNEIGPVDIPMIETNENLMHDYATNTYTFGDAEKGLDKNLVKKGNVLRFEPKTNKIAAQGDLDFALDYGVINERIVGDVTTDLAQEDYNFNVSIALPFDWDKELLEKMAYYLFEDNFDMNDINYDNTALMQQWAQLVSDKSLNKLTEEFTTTGFFNKPKDLKETMVFSNITMKYDPLERAYRSEGKLGLAFVGDKAIHKEINGWIEFGHRLGSDYMNIYLKTSLGDYLYFTFSGTNMEIVTSLDDINGTINSIDGSKRRIKGENDMFYIYYLGNNMKARSFLQRMKAIGSGEYDGSNNPFTNPTSYPDTSNLDGSKGLNINGAGEQNVQEPPKETPVKEMELEKTPSPAVPDAVREYEENANKKKGKNKDNNDSSSFPFESPNDAAEDEVEEEIEEKTEAPKKTNKEETVPSEEVIEEPEESIKEEVDEATEVEEETIEDAEEKSNGKKDKKKSKKENEEEVIEIE